MDPNRSASASFSKSLPLEVAREIDRTCDELRAELEAGKQPTIEEYLGRVSEGARAVLLRELIVTELEYQIDQGGRLEPSAYLARFPNDHETVEAAFRRLMGAASKLPKSDSPFQPSPGDRKSAEWASQNLVFGIIALQNDFITREALVAGFDAWVHDKSRTLAEILTDQGALSTADQEFLNRLVARFFEKHGYNAQQGLAALGSISRLRPELERLHDAELSASLTCLRDAVPSDSPFAATTSFTVANHQRRFRILRPHAQGGLGQVSVALDQELNREVALKEIQPKHADNAVARERLLLEAEITGALEHPGIVPVYGLGQDPDGRPYYAMRFVKGDSLKQAIEDFHKPDHPNRKNPGLRHLALRQLLGRFIDVCNAMEYAHSRGVLHRDLKPGNIMVGKYGETLVVDWGLAKSVGKKEMSSDEAPLCPSSALSSSGQTIVGQPIGTPAYMSPEQAAGTLEKLGVASDVYSLGATLYQLLCGKAPFEGPNLAEILDRVARGAFPPPNAVVADIAPTLQAICLKAMATQPDDRYPTARALADDLENWLADAPITASPDTFLESLARGIRKNPTITVGLSAALFGATLALGIYFSSTAPKWVESAQQFQAALMSDHFSPELADLATLVFDAGTADDRNANGEKVRAYQRAIAVQERLVAEHPDRSQLGIDLANSYRLTAQFLKEHAAWRGAISMYENTIALTSRLHAQHPELSEIVDDLITDLHELSWLLATCPADDIADGESAITLATRACELAEWKSAASLVSLAAGYARTGRFDQAVQFLDLALATQSDVYLPEIAAHRALYQSQTPFIESSVPPSEP